MSEWAKGQRALLLRGFKAALEASQPDALLKHRVKLVKGGTLAITDSNIRLNLKKFDKIFIMGAGKATGGMAVALEAVLGSSTEFTGAIIVPEGTAKNYKTRRVTLTEATHPQPSSTGVRATKLILRLLESSTRDSLVMCLFSGGGSSLMTLPASGISLAEKRNVTNLLLRRGASIGKVNCVRKHLSQIKGGLLPTFANGATILNLLISDIVGTPLDSIASGPTVPDSSTFRQALSILKEYDLGRQVSRRHSSIQEGSHGTHP